jgi:surface polysaccharide O-acyltransferase-like enzyme
MFQASKRNSAIELLRIIAIFIIVIAHSLPIYGTGIQTVDFNMNVKDVNGFLMICELYLGQIGNTIFVVCSAWFLTDSHWFSSRKITRIITDCFVISIVWLLIIELLGFDVGIKNIVKQFLPISFDNNWFVGIYLILYILHPYLNKICDNTAKRQHFLLAVGGLLWCGCY